MGVTGAGSDQLSGGGDVHGCAAEHGLQHFGHGACRPGRQGALVHGHAGRGRGPGAGRGRPDDACRPGDDHPRGRASGRSGGRAGDDQRNRASDRDGGEPGWRAGLFPGRGRHACRPDPVARQPERRNRRAKRDAGRGGHLLLRRAHGRKHDPHLFRRRQRHDDACRLTRPGRGPYRRRHRLADTGHRGREPIHDQPLAGGRRGPRLSGGGQRHAGIAADDRRAARPGYG